MKKSKLKVTEVFTRPHEILFGVIEVLPQDAEGKDLTKVTSFEKHVPAMRALCYNSPRMYTTLKEVTRMCKTGSTAKEIHGYVLETIEAVKNSYKAYEPIQLGED